MKLKITDQFLYDVLLALNETAYVAGSFIGPRGNFRKVLPYHRNPVFEKYRKQKNAAGVRKLIHHLKTKNYIQVKSLKGEKGIMLTPGGMAKALKAGLMLEQQKKRNDGKWIMIIFDVPQRHPKARNLLKSILVNSGFKLLQQSVWVTDADVYEKIVELFQFHDLERYVKIFLIEALG